MRELYLSEIRSFEGFATDAKWDYAQFTNGYGTKARFEGERIDEAEAKTRFAAEIEQARNFVERHAQGWDEGTKAALTSLTFNAGTRWASSGLGEAVRSFDIDSVREKFLSYTKAGGVDLPGLVRRRLEEVSWIGRDGDPVAALMATTADHGARPTGAIVTSAAAPRSSPSPEFQTAPASPAQPSETAMASPLTASERHSIASLDLILLALELAATPSLASARQGDDAKAKSGTA